jgi:hypothetical protein
MTASLRVQKRKNAVVRSGSGHSQGRRAQSGRGEHREEQARIEPAPAATRCPPRSAAHHPGRNAIRQPTQEVTWRTVESGS